MIRFFSALCKALFKIISTDEQVFHDATGDFQLHSAKCPYCGAIGMLAPYGGYFRHLVSYERGKIIDRLVRPFRFECKSCKKTHALLPDILIPYSPYSIRFKLSVLIAYFERETTVVAICEHFRIAVATLYAWKKSFLEHKELMMGVLVNRKQTALVFLNDLFEIANLSSRIESFFRLYSFSFLQNRSVPATRSLPP